MAGRVSGKVALITGGGSGIGRATAIVFGREGAKVAIADYNRDGGEQTVRMIKDAGGQALFIEANVAISKQAEAMIAKTIETYGRLDCAFNNAGIEGQVGQNIADCSEENWGLIIAVNLTGVFLCMKYEIPQMLKQGGGSIVNTASAAGLIGLPGGTASGEQAWRRRADEIGGARIRQVRHQNQRRMSGVHPHRNGGARDRRRLD